jgi:hypothetical protein
MKIILTILYVLLLSVSGTQAQTAEQADAKIAGYLAMLDASPPPSDQQSRVLNDSIATYLVRIGSRLPASLNFPMARSIAEGELLVKNSIDGRLRIYTWNTRQYPQSGTTMVASVIQWKTSKGVIAVAPLKVAGDSAEQYDIVGECQMIETVTTRSNKTVYLVFDRHVDIPIRWQETVTALTIENDNLKAYPIFKTDGEKHNKITLRFNPYFGKDNVMHFGNGKQYLFVPLVYENSKIGKFMDYNFDGNCYVFDVNAR